MTANKVALITGSSRGIGAETAKLFAKNGYAVCINYVSNDVAAEKIKNEIIENGGHCICVKADVSLASNVQRLFDAVDKELGGISILVNNAGILKQQSRMEDLCCKEAVKRLSTKQGGNGGSIVNVSSMASKTGSPNEYVDYAAT